MKIRKILPMLLGIAILFAGCAKTPGNDTDREAGDTTAAGTEDMTETAGTIEADIPEDQEAGESGEDYIPRQPEESIVTYSYQSTEMPSDDGESVYLYVDYTKPEVHLENAEAAEKIQSVFDKIYDENEAESGRMLVEVKELAGELGDDFDSSYALSQGFDEMRIDGHILSLRSSYYTYYAGAHGYTVYTGLNFDLDTGEKLTLDSIAADKALLCSSVHDYIEEMLQVPRYSERLAGSVEEAMDIVDTSVIQDDYWYFTDCGITFVAHPYELGSYAAGFFFFQVPFEKINGLKPEYTYSGAYRYPVLIGTDVSKDLDGDGREDTIIYDSIESDDYSAAKLSLLINNIDFTPALEEDEIFLGYGSTANMADEYYLIDLDNSDSFIEIALKNYGDNDFLSTYFFRYDGEEVSYLGFISDFPENSTCEIPGDGTITANTSLNLLETRKISVQYRISEGGKLETVPQNWYYPQHNNQAADYSGHAILKDVTVHKEKSLESDTVTLTAADGPVQFPATDNEHWFVVQTADEEIYYLYLSDFSTTEDGELAYDVFENLFLVG